MAISVLCFINENKTIELLFCTFYELCVMIIMKLIKGFANKSKT